MNDFTGLRTFDALEEMDETGQGAVMTPCLIHVVCKKHLFGLVDRKLDALVTDEIPAHKIRKIVSLVRRNTGASNICKQAKCGMNLLYKVKAALE